MGILKSQADGSAVKTTFNNLVSLIIDEELDAGQVYEITDWQTYYKQWNGIAFVNAAADYSVVSTTNSEPLLVTALSTDILSNEAQSTIFPEDEIYIEILPDPDPAQSRILYRKDQRLGVEAHYDWRFVQFPRWAITVNVTTPKGTTTIIDEITSLYTEGLYSGWSWDVADYSNLNFNEQIGAQVTNNHQLALVDSVSYESMEFQVNVLSSKYAHFLTFGDNFATGFSDVKIMPDADQNASFYNQSSFDGGGNNIVFYVPGIPDFHNLEFNNCANITIGPQLDNTKFTNSNGVTLYQTGSDNNLRMNSVIICGNEEYLLSDTIFSNNKGDLLNSIVSPYVNIQNNRIDNVNKLFLGSGLVSGLAPTTYSNFQLNELADLDIVAIEKEAATDFYSAFHNKVQKVQRIRYTVQFLEHNNINSLENGSIIADFSKNHISQILDFTIREIFNDNIIKQTELNLIDFGTNPIECKYRDAQMSTFEKEVDVTDTNRVDGDLQFQIYDDEIQYIGIFNCIVPSSIIEPETIEIYSMSAPIPPNTFAKNQHRIQLQATGLLDLIIWHTAPLDPAIDQLNNLVLGNTNYLPLVGRNFDWCIFRPYEVYGVNSWMQWDAQSYDTFGYVAINCDDVELRYLDFVSTSNQYLEYSSTDYLVEPFNGGLTFEGWFELNPGTLLDQNNEHALQSLSDPLSSATNGTDYDYVYASIVPPGFETNSPVTEWALKIRAQNTADTGTDYVAYAPIGSNPSGYNHYAIRFLNGSDWNTASGLEFWYNGSFITKSYENANLAGEINFGDQTLSNYLIGAAFIPGSSEPNDDPRYFAGKLTQQRVWLKYLNSTEISFLSTDLCNKPSNSAELLHWLELEPDTGITPALQQANVKGSTPITMTTINFSISELQPGSDWAEAKICQENCVELSPGGGGGGGGGSNDDCCDEIDALKFQDLQILSFSITNVSGSVSGQFNPANTGLSRERGEVIDQFQLSYNLSKSNSKIASVQLTFVPQIGAPISVATFNNQKEVTNLPINIAPSIINSTGEFQLLAISTETPPAGGSDSTTASLEMTFEYAIFWSKFDQAGPITSTQLSGFNKKLVSELPQEFKYSNSASDSWIYLAIPVNLITAPQISTGVVQSPFINLNGQLTNAWENYTVSLTEYSTPIVYYVFRTQYIQYANTWQKIEIENF